MDTTFPERIVVAIYVTGDTHGKATRFSAHKWKFGKTLSRDDIVIVAGNFGFVWDGSKTDSYWLDWFESKPWTTCFIDGNHENHDLLSRYPVFTWNQGDVHVVRPHVLHLMRGEVYSIDGTTIFTMGGASSHDMEFRKEGKTWWRSELPNNAEHEHARKTLEEAEWKVDFVITHDAPSNIALELCAICERDFYPTNPLQRFLEELSEHVQFKRWIHGRYHLDRKIDKRHRAIYGDKRRKAHSIPKLWGFLPFIEDPLVFQITTTLFYRLQAIC